MVTRPEHQADHFCDLLASKSIDSYRFPTMEISTVDSSCPQEITVDPLDMVIFISANAVIFSKHYFDQKAFPSSCHIAAIGNKTTKALQESGYQVDLVADRPFNTEAFLSLPAMQNILNKRILIIKGCGGRKTLQNTLTARGAHVQTCNVYERKQANHSVKRINAICEGVQVDIIAITSFDSANYFFDFFKDCIAFKHVPLLVGSQRIAHALAKLNIANQLVVSNNPSDECMLETLIKWIKDVE